MKSIFLKIILFFSSFLKNRQFRRINRKLYKTLEDREVDRIILKGRIVKMVKQYIAINTSSDFIPPWIKSNAEIREEILIKYGDEMKQLNVKIYNNLKLSA